MSIVFARFGVLRTSVRAITMRAMAISSFVVSVWNCVNRMLTQIAEAVMACQRDTNRA
jgi:hypothetical protein